MAMGMMRGREAEFRKRFPATKPIERPKASRNIDRKEIMGASWLDNHKARHGLSGYGKDIPPFGTSQQIVHPEYIGKMHPDSFFKHRKTSSYAKRMVKRNQSKPGYQKGKRGGLFRKTLKGKTYKKK